MSAAFDHPFLDTTPDTPAPLAKDVVCFREALRIAEKHGVNVTRILGRDRRQGVSNARRELFAVLKALGWSYPEIGEQVGGRDHTTVMAALGVTAKAKARAAKRDAKAAA